VLTSLRIAEPLIALPLAPVPAERRPMRLTEWVDVKGADKRPLTVKCYEDM
jgi:hypothetical protein